MHMDEPSNGVCEGMHFARFLQRERQRIEKAMEHRRMANLASYAQLPELLRGIYTEQPAHNTLLFASQQDLMYATLAYTGKGQLQW